MTAGKVPEDSETPKGGKLVDDGKRESAARRISLRDETRAEP